MFDSVLAERKRLQALLKFEKKARSKGFRSIAGIDEAGRGPLAGPVVAAACILPQGILLPGLNDSKKLTALQRDRLYEALTSHPEVQYGVGIVDHLIIDMINILQATIQAMLKAIEALLSVPDLLLVDGMALPQTPIPSWKIIRGDEQSQSIAAASVLAKVTRDRLMEKHHEEWPIYDFKKNKGYGTRDHLDVLKQMGPCPIHRLSFQPIKGSNFVLTPSKRDGFIIK